MEPWYKVATPRKEVREGRSFNPDEFAIALEQVVAGTAPEDYREARPVLRAHLLHAGAARARGHGAAPALGQDREHRAGAHAHHPVRRRQDAHADHALPPGDERRSGGRLHRAWPIWCGRRASPSVPKAQGCRVRGQCLGPAARGARRRGSTSPASSRATRASRRSARRRRPRRPAPRRSRASSQAAGAPVLLLFDEVLNFLNRHRGERRVLPRLHPEPDRRHHRHHARRVR